MEKIDALAKFLECEPDDLSLEKWDQYGLEVYSGNGGEYAIGTDEEADKAVHEEIKSCVWAFNASFLASFTDLPEEVFQALQPQCEGANEAILAIIDKSGLESFVEQAVSCDGRGHFLSGYDGDEGEAGEYFVYRTN